MTKTKLVSLARLTPLAALFSCAAPKAIVVEQAPQPEPVVTAVEPEVSEVAEPAGPTLADDGIRLPDMATMPEDDELRASNPGPDSPGTDSGAVIARPPLDPPSRPKSGE